MVEMYKGNLSCDQTSLILIQKKDFCRTLPPTLRKQLNYLWLHLENIHLGVWELDVTIALANYRVTNNESTVLLDQKKTLLSMGVKLPGKQRVPACNVSLPRHSILNCTQLGLNHCSKERHLPLVEVVFLIQT